MAGMNEAQRSDRFDLPKNMAFTFIIRILGQFHAVTALCFVHACHVFYYSYVAMGSMQQK
ncbi:MAG: hypothetical protein LBC02_03915 [Planctomycetaceae bacterium]|jgi:hypothetical protein|nr:hypothetical protein [Planctomycetaceae bacterium]